MTSRLINFPSYLPTLFHLPGVLLNKELIWCGLTVVLRKSTHGWSTLPWVQTRGRADIQVINIVYY